MNKKKVYLLLALTIVLTSCAPTVSTPMRPAGYGEEINGQPDFPDLVEYWVVDNGCNFSLAAKENAFRVFEALNREHIAQVAVVCQKGINGGYADATTWISEWLNHEGLGSMIDKRAVAILIRPDAKPEDFRIIINPNDEIYWWTPSDEYPIKREAADYANYNDFDGALNSLVRNMDAFMRAKWEKYGPTPVQ